MDRFNSNEAPEGTFKSQAKDIVFSDISNNEKVESIINSQKEAYHMGQKSLLNDLIDTMNGVVLIDRKFIGEYVSRTQNRLPIYED